MTPKTIRDALHTIFWGVVPSLTLVKGEPDNIQVTPTLYTLYQGFSLEDSDNAKLQAVTHRYLHRLCLTYQENEVAEDLLLDISHAIVAAVEADPKLSGLLHHNGRATITAGDAGFTEIPTGGTKYRTIDLESEVLEVTENA